MMDYALRFSPFAIEATGRGSEAAVSESEPGIPTSAALLRARSCCCW